MLYKENPDKEDEENSKKMAQLLAIATSVLMNPGSLRQAKDTTASTNRIDRPSPLWRQSGYLHSGIDAVVRAKIIENRSNNMVLHQTNSKRQSSMQEEECQS